MSDETHAGVTERKRGSCGGEGPSAEPPLLQVMRVYQFAAAVSALPLRLFARRSGELRGARPESALRSRSRGRTCLRRGAPPPARRPRALRGDRPRALGRAPPDRARRRDCPGRCRLPARRCPEVTVRPALARSARARRPAAPHVGMTVKRPKKRDSRRQLPKLKAPKWLQTYRNLHELQSRSERKSARSGAFCRAL
jgi:hypothetical protein